MDLGSRSAREKGRQSDVARDVAKLIPAMRGFARSLTRNADDADDLVQEALTRAIANIHQFSPGTNLKAWMFAILRNTHISLSKRRRREWSMTSATGAEDVGRPAPQPWRAATSALQGALDQLPIDQRQAVVLIGGLGFSYDECAEICGCKIGTIKSRLNRGRARLATLLDAETVDDI